LFIVAAKVKYGGWYFYSLQTEKFKPNAYDTQAVNVSPILIIKYFNERLTDAD
jgi:hypothetical protein